MKTPQSSTVLQWLQLIVLTVGVATFFMDMGRKTESLSSMATDLTELKGIVQDLVKSQVTVAVNDARHQQILDNLQDRVEDLERRTRAN